MKIPREILGTIGKCIYCGNTNECLQTEHIIPYGLNGHWELRKATCDECASITSAFEMSVLRDSLIELRTALNLSTRRKKRRPKTFPLIITKDGKQETINVPIHKHAVIVNFPISLPPAYLDGRHYESGVDFTGVTPIIVGGLSLEELHKLHNAKTLSVTQPWQGNDFERMIAKIAYGFTIAHFGINNMEKVYVIPAILGKKDDVGYWVGSAKDNKLDVGKHLHLVELSTLNREVIARVKLFALYDVPEYLVVVGRVSEHIGHRKY